MGKKREGGEETRERERERERERGERERERGEARLRSSPSSCFVLAVFGFFSGLLHLLLLFPLTILLASLRHG